MRILAKLFGPSGAPESDNLAIKGVAENATKRHMITSAYEHKAVIDTFKYLESRGFDVTYLEPNRSGLVTPEPVSAAIREDTLLVSVMQRITKLGGFNEIGPIGKICREQDVLMHTDAAQSPEKSASMSKHNALTL
ncbi:MAG: hypothetical protein Ct9H300mP8_05220 [Gammaproteobacteria bacterium]|nr:MAG: hypothetical protein Ct9H300mP8_05220 [Gammaproteobacteria bacterium]